MAAYPDTLLGFCYLNPRHGEAALAELDRCLRHRGMVGIKLWIACKATDPLVDPILERAAALGVPVLQHAWLKTVGQMEFESTPADVAAMGRRHPRATIIMAHLMGAGYRDPRHRPGANVDRYLGGDPEAGVVEFAVRHLGAGDCCLAPTRRGAHTACNGKVLAARLTAAERDDPVRQRGDLRR